MLPHFLKHNARIAAIGGHNGITLLFWTFCNLTRVTPHFKAHEYRHVVQEVVLTAVGLVLNITVTVLAGWSWVSWLVSIVLAPLWFVVPYFLAMIPGGYQKNIFERDAERYANRIAPR